MIKRPSEIFPALLLTEFRRLAKLDFPFATLQPLDFPTFRIDFHVPTFLKRLCQVSQKEGEMDNSGGDAAGMVAAVAWIKEGPKIVRVRQDQYEALRHVDVNVELCDFKMPYPSLLVDLSEVEGSLHTSCLVHQPNPDILICHSMSKGNIDDVATVIRHRPGVLTEESLERYDESLQNISVASCQTLRVSLNMALALTNFGCQARVVFPEEKRRDEKLAQEESDRGERAKARLRETPMEVDFTHEVRLYHREGGHESDPAGREVGFHWRRGHWAMQAHGPHHSLRKRIFRAPMMVRADLMTGEKAGGTVIYK